MSVIDMLYLEEIARLDRHDDQLVAVRIGCFCAEFCNVKSKLTWIGTSK